MLKINLEKELVKQNKSIVSARELLLINEYERTANLEKHEVIKRVFGALPAAEGGRIKTHNERLLSQTKDFNQERVFHISQIEKLCKKYHLRFLPSVFFRGSIDKELPGKISQFEIAYGVECKKWERNQYSLNELYQDGNTYIAAPVESFNLQEKPQDPLMFFAINSEYYYLIHKWGNDISLVRRCYSFLSSVLVSTIIMLAPAIFWFSFFSVFNSNQKIDTKEIVGLIVISFALLFLILQATHGEDGLRIVKRNYWKSPFKS